MHPKTWLPLSYLIISSYMHAPIQALSTIEDISVPPHSLVEIGPIVQERSTGSGSNQQSPEIQEGPIGGDSASGQSSTSLLPESQIPYIFRGSRCTGVIRDDIAQGFADASELFRTSADSRVINSAAPNIRDLKSFLWAKTPSATIQSQSAQPALDVPDLLTFHLEVMELLGNVNNHRTKASAVNVWCGENDVLNSVQDANKQSTQQKAALQRAKEFMEASCRPDSKYLVPSPSFLPVLTPSQ